MLGGRDVAVLAVGVAANIGLVLVTQVLVGRRAAPARGVGLAVAGSGSPPSSCSPCPTCCSGAELAFLAARRRAGWSPPSWSSPPDESESCNVPDALTPERATDDLAIALTYYSPYVSGLTNMARDIAEGLAARGRRVTVVTSHFDSGLPLEEEINGVRVLRAPVVARVGPRRGQPPARRAGPADAGPGQVASLQLPMLEAGAIAAGLRTPLISTYHCDVTLPPGLVNDVQRVVVDASNRLAMRHSVAVDGDQRGLRPAQPHVAVDRAVDGGRRAAVPGAAGRAAALPRDRRPAHRLPRPDRAREGPRAPGPRLPRAARPGRPAADRRRLQPCRGRQRVSQVRAAMGDDPRIRLLGFVPEERLGDFYASLDVFTLPSVNAFEAFGIVQAVAMLAGVPVLSSDIPGVRQPVVQTGFGTLVPARGRAGDHPRRCRSCTRTRRTARVGADRAHRAFSVANVLDAYEVLLDKAASAAGRPVPPGDRRPLRRPATTGTTAGGRPARAGWYARLVRRYCGPGPLPRLRLRHRAPAAPARAPTAPPRGSRSRRGRRPRPAHRARRRRVRATPPTCPTAAFGALVAVHVLEHLDDDAGDGRARHLAPRAGPGRPRPGRHARPGRSRPRAIRARGGSGSPTRRTSTSSRTRAGGTLLVAHGFAVLREGSDGLWNVPYGRSPLNAAVGWSVRGTSSGPPRRSRSTSPDGSSCRPGAGRVGGVRRRAAAGTCDL